MIELTAISERQLDWSFAGDTLNCAAAIHAACSECDVDFLTGIGDDSMSDDFVRFCSELGVDVSHSPVVAGRNLGLYWISTKDGERDFRYWRNESAARHVLESGIRLPEPSYDAVVLSNITLAVAGVAAEDLIEEMRKLRRRGTKLAIDLNYRAALWNSVEDARRVVDAALTAVDIIVASHDDISALWGDDPDAFCDRAAASGVAEAVVTRGSGPITASVTGRRFRINPPEVAVVDTTGAGDAFMGTYIAHRLRDQPAEVAVADAAKVASGVVQERGALSYLLKQ